MDEGMIKGAGAGADVVVVGGVWLGLGAAGDEAGAALFGEDEDGGEDDEATVAFVALGVGGEGEGTADIIGRDQDDDERTDDQGITVMGWWWELSWFSWILMDWYFTS